MKNLGTEIPKERGRRKKGKILNFPLILNPPERKKRAAVLQTEGQILKDKL